MSNLISDMNEKEMKEHIERINAVRDVWESDNAWSPNETYRESLPMYIPLEPVDSNVYFYVKGYEMGDYPILELKSNGDIMVKGKKIERDTQVVDALREMIGLDGIERKGMSFEICKEESSE